VADAEALRSAIAAVVPDVAIIDIRMPPTHTDEGLRAAIDIRRDHAGVGVLVFSQYVETRYATRLLADRPAGVGYLLPRTATTAGCWPSSATSAADLTRHCRSAVRYSNVGTGPGLGLATA
jgi:CheY-like chemotaxis protein